MNLSTAKPMLQRFFRTIGFGLLFLVCIFVIIALVTIAPSLLLLSGTLLHIALAPRLPTTPSDADAIGATISLGFSIGKILGLIASVILVPVGITGIYQIIRYGPDKVFAPDSEIEIHKNYLQINDVKVPRSGTSLTPSPESKTPEHDKFKSILAQTEALEHRLKKERTAVLKELTKNDELVAEFVKNYPQYNSEKVKRVAFDLYNERRERKTTLIAIAGAIGGLSGLVSLLLQVLHH